ncbi:MAG: DUF4328 domain-containing protein [Verrucomicrobiae bacterium]|nr:DUF4328 domain-containing protein [Verrucomicrobiae bacterium]
MEWYAGIGGEKVGPMPESELRVRHERGEITADTLVWSEGLTDWIPFSESEPAKRPRLDPLSPVPVGEDLVRCAASGEWRPASDMLQYGDAWIAPEHKDAFLQGLREGKHPTALSWGGYQYRDPQKLGVSTWWLILVGTIIGSLITTISLVVNFVSRQSTGPGSTPPGELPIWVAVNASFSCAYLLLFAATVILFMMWTYRVAANAYALGAAWVRVSPGWAVGWYFVPVASLFMPYLAMADISRASVSPEEGENGNTPVLIKAWWTFWIASNVISFFGGLLAPLGHLEASQILSSIYIPLGIVSAVFACRMITFVTRAQQTTASSHWASQPVSRSDA